MGRGGRARRFFWFVAASLLLLGGVPTPTPATAANQHTPCPQATHARGQIAAAVTIYRDRYGVPHVYGRTDRDCALGFAYARAEDNFWQIEDNTLRALGRASEVYGEKTLREDQMVHTLDIPRLAQEEYLHSDARMRRLYDGFADGTNRFLACQHRRVHPRLLTRLEPWYPLALLRYKYYQTEMLLSVGLRPEELKGVQVAV